MSEFDSRQYIQTLSPHPGVYRMLDAQGKPLYVGKAKNLKKRVAAYFNRSQRSPRLTKMISQTAAIETTVTNTEAEALLLENNLIKRHHPRYNILLRDDKSYPYIFISSEHDYPQITFYRGRRERKGRYFGPYASPGAARSALSLLQKVFKVRQCDDYFFSHRSRPCLQYQIDRCSGPCVGLIDKDSYGNEIEAAIEFLEGNSHALIARYVDEMDQASADLNYEAARTLSQQNRDAAQGLRAAVRQRPDRRCRYCSRRIGGRGRLRAGIQHPCRNEPRQQELFSQDSGYRKRGENHPAPFWASTTLATRSPRRLYSVIVLRKLDSCRRC